MFSRGLCKLLSSPVTGGALYHWRKETVQHYVGRNWDVIQSWNLRCLQHPCRQKEKDRDRRDCPPMLLVFLEKKKKKKKTASNNCICHFLDTRDSAFWNCCFDLCLSDHKQDPYQNNWGEITKWNETNGLMLDMWASALTASGTSTSIQSFQRLSCFSLEQIKNSKPYLSTVKFQPILHIILEKIVIKLSLLRKARSSSPVFVAVLSVITPNLAQ